MLASTAFTASVVSASCWLISLSQVCATKVSSTMRIPRMTSCFICKHATHHWLQSCNGPGCHLHCRPNCRRCDWYPPGSRRQPRPTDGLATHSHQNAERSKQLAGHLPAIACPSTTPSARMHRRVLRMSRLQCTHPAWPGHDGKACILSGRLSDAA